MAPFTYTATYRSMSFLNRDRPLFKYCALAGVDYLEVYSEHLNSLQSRVNSLRFNPLQQNLVVPRAKLGNVHDNRPIPQNTPVKIGAEIPIVSHSRSQSA
jgi:hypothetical protein